MFFGLGLDRMSNINNSGFQHHVSYKELVA